MLPLQGIRILDLSRMVAGAYCSMILADLGAEVIKIEQPGIGDDTRQWGPPYVHGESAYFLCVNRNKQSLTLDLRKEKAQGVFRELVKRADVVLENFRPGTMEKFQLGYQDLKKLKSDLIYCSITAFGLTGPYKNRPGTDPALQATGGMMGLLGEAEGKRKEELTGQAAELTQKAINIYKGDFLARETEEPWSISIRERFRSKFLRNVSRLGNYWEQIGKYEKALECYERGLEVDSLAEELYRHLILCYQHLDRKAEALSVYNRCKRILTKTLGIEPSRETQTLYKNLLTSNR